LLAALATSVVDVHDGALRAAQRLERSLDELATRLREHLHGDRNRGSFSISRRAKSYSSATPTEPTDLKPSSTSSANISSFFATDIGWTSA
jgi:hypothetical protein